MRLAVLVEAILNKIRYRLVNKIRHAELATLETGELPFYARLVMRDTVKVSNFTASVITVNSGVYDRFYDGLHQHHFHQGFVPGSRSCCLFCFLVYSSRRKVFRTMWLETSEYETWFYEKLGHI